MKKFLVLTKPTPLLDNFSIRKIGSFAKYTLKEISEKDIGGHFAVTRSLVEGLKKNNYKFDLNKPLSKRYDSVIVLSGEDTLIRTIEAKSKGLIKKIIAGPNIVVLPLDGSAALVDESIDAIIVPSYWVKEAYIQQVPRLKEKIIVWPVGIDENYWAPAISKKQKNNVLIYWKTESAEFYKEVEKNLKSMNFQTSTVKYGHYNMENFKKKLNKAGFSVFLSRSESQGIALLESWAMDVPSFVWNPKKFVFNGWNYKPVSSSPYLTKNSGAEWSSLKELNILLKRYDNRMHYFKPRSYVLNEFTDRITSKRLIEMLQERGLL